MFTQAEDLPIIGADPLEDTVVVEKAVVEDRDLGGVAIVVLSIDPDRGGHRGVSPGWRKTANSEQRSVTSDP